MNSAGDGSTPLGDAVTAGWSLAAITAEDNSEATGEVLMFGVVVFVLVITPNVIVCIVDGICTVVLVFDPVEGQTMLLVIGNEVHEPS